MSGEVHSLAGSCIYPVLAYCERCGYECHTATQARKFCPVPQCRGYLVHIDRGRHRA